MRGGGRIARSSAAMLEGIEKRTPRIVPSLGHQSGHQTAFAPEKSEGPTLQFRSTKQKEPHERGASLLVRAEGVEPGPRLAKNHTPSSSLATKRLRCSPMDKHNDEVEPTAIAA